MSSMPMVPVTMSDIGRKGRGKEQMAKGQKAKKTPPGAAAF